jgi:acyl carrier protein
MAVQASSPRDGKKSFGSSRLKQTYGGGMNDRDYVFSKVQEAFKIAFDVDPRQVTMETSASDIPLWDSVGHLSLASHLEEVFGISLDVDELMEMENVREIVRVITPKLSEKARSAVE